MQSQGRSGGVTGTT